MSFETDAITAWSEPDPRKKCALVHGLTPPDQTIHVTLPGLHAGVPDKPTLINPQRVPQRKLQQSTGRAALLHAIAHIEFNAINLALDAALRFPDLPLAYTHDWIRVAKEEVTHFSLLNSHLATYGATYGDYDAHDGLWDMAIRTSDDVLARMALVPRVMEARGLDVTPGLIEKFKQAGDTRAAEILSIILEEEVEHVAIGNRWYAILCAKRGFVPTAQFALLQSRYRAPKLRPPFNTVARLRAGFTEEELAQWSQ